MVSSSIETIAFTEVNKQKKEHKSERTCSKPKKQTKSSLKIVNNHNSESTITNIIFIKTRELRKKDNLLVQKSNLYCKLLIPLFRA